MLFRIFVLSIASLLAACGGGDEPPAASTPTATVYSANPLAIAAGSIAIQSTGSGTGTVSVSAAAYNATFSTNDGFATVTPSSGTAVIRLGGNAVLHCPLGMAGGTLAQLQAGRVLVSSNLQRVTSYDELLNQTFDELNCGGRAQPAQFNADGSVTLTYADGHTETEPRALFAEIFTAEGLHFVGNGEDNRHRAEIYKMQFEGRARYIFVMMNDENLSTGHEQSVALFVSR